MATSTAEELPLHTDTDVVLARQRVRQLCQEQGFSIVDQTKMVTAASELGRNARTHGKGGVMTAEKVTDGVRKGVRLTFIDNGPGIPDLELAFKDGWTSGGGLGMGLSGAKRLVQDFEIDTTPGQGTTIVVARWR